MRVRLRPGVHVLWRGKDSAQVGYLDDSPLVFMHLSVAQMQQLEQLATRQGLVNQRRNEVFDALHAADFLVARNEMSRHGQPNDSFDNARIAILGLGITGSTLAFALARRGIKNLTIMDDAPVLASDVSGGYYTVNHIDTARQTALGELVAVQAPHVNLLPLSHSRPDLVVVIDQYVAHNRVTPAFMRHDIPHLSVVLSNRRNVIGPYVVPGQGCCLRCLDLHRSDNDDAWPVVATQLATLGQRHPLKEDPGLALATASTISNQIMTVLSHKTPVTRGATLELALPEALPSVRTWPVHPECGCDTPIS